PAGPAPPRRSVCAPAALSFPTVPQTAPERKCPMTLRSIRAALRSAPPRPRARAADRRAGFRPRLELLEDPSLPSATVVLHSNELLLQSLPSQPPRAPLARNMALVHVAMFDAVNAIDRSYEPYAAHVHASHGASLEAAAAQAAHDTLAALYPSRQ